jgi:hypothetical protein
MLRRSLVLALLLILWRTAPCQAGNASQWALDAGTMKAALHTATIEEGGFVEQVVEMTRQGTLPVSLVDSTFQWARKKPTYKFQYFKHGLILRARRLGIDLSAGSGVKSQNSWFKNALQAVTPGQ